VLLTAVLAIMVGKTVRTMQGVGWVPITPVEMELPYWTGLWLGVFPTLETALAQLGAVVFVVGSYLLAERLKRRSRRRARVRETEPSGDRGLGTVLGNEL
jgi:high-affinity iron transporter